jgi:hypothetical protein
MLIGIVRILKARNKGFSPISDIVSPYMKEIEIIPPRRKEEEIRALRIQLAYLMVYAPVTIYEAPRERKPTIPETFLKILGRMMEESQNNHPH